jgi:hypothetical protein
MFVIQRKPRISLVIEGKIGKTLTDQVTAGTVDLDRWAELAHVRILMAGLAASIGPWADGPAAPLAGSIAFVAARALGPGVGSHQFVSGPRLVIETPLP